MITEPTCPACANHHWRPLAKREYRQANIASYPPYIQKRLEVLFHVWHEDKPAVELTAVLCQSCGFVCYTPRPDQEDISAKYRFLARDSQTSHEISRHTSSDDARSAMLLTFIQSYLSPSTSILDFGGGNGRLMSSFISNGYDCSLIDFPGEKIPGVKYIGSQLNDVPATTEFGAIVVSHVLEHLADPHQVLLELRNYVKNDGILYVEVPLEIWKSPPLPDEPVTHINYFTSNSLTALLERAGYSAVHCTEGIYITEDGATGLAIRAIAKPSASIPISGIKGNAEETLALLNPNTFHKVMRAFRYPAIFKRDIRRSILNSLGKTPFLWRIAKKNSTQAN